ncbi:TPA: hypothetical protein N0F65_005866 [Lagenidium giganteum]|uniref:Uncharacterized protein n=1 Tax=Lagenidium giganteum TaxID=4803 RepID=A0AAV2YN80_9STRA|nr:TPA: hypothetical protein N0F65_005866 [Lagenidium giganteum]
MGRPAPKLKAPKTKGAALSKKQKRRKTKVTDARGEAVMGTTTMGAQGIGQHTPTKDKDALAIGTGGKECEKCGNSLWGGESAINTKNGSKKIGTNGCQVCDYVGYRKTQRACVQCERINCEYFCEWCGNGYHLKCAKTCNENVTNPNGFCCKKCEAEQADEETGDGSHNESTARCGSCDLPFNSSAKDDEDEEDESGFKVNQSVLVENEEVLYNAVITDVDAPGERIKIHFIRCSKSFDNWYAMDDERINESLACDCCNQWFHIGCLPPIKSCGRFKDTTYVCPTCIDDAKAYHCGSGRAKESKSNGPSKVVRSVSEDVAPSAPKKKSKPVITSDDEDDDEDMHVEGVVRNPSPRVGKEKEKSNDKLKNKPKEKKKEDVKAKDAERPRTKEADKPKAKEAEKPKERVKEKSKEKPKEKPKEKAKEKKKASPKDADERPDKKRKRSVSDLGAESKKSKASPSPDSKKASPSRKDPPTSKRHDSSVDETDPATSEDSSATYRSARASPKATTPSTARAKGKENERSSNGVGEQMEAEPEPIDKIAPPPRRKISFHSVSALLNSPSSTETYLEPFKPHAVSHPLHDERTTSYNAFVKVEKDKFVLGGRKRDEIWSSARPSKTNPASGGALSAFDILREVATQSIGSDLAANAKAAHAACSPPQKANDSANKEVSRQPSASTATVPSSTSAHPAVPIIPPMTAQERINAKRVQMNSFVDLHFNIRKEMYLRFCALEEEGYVEAETAQLLRALIYPTSERFQDLKFVYLVNKDMPPAQLTKRLLELAPTQPTVAAASTATATTSSVAGSCCSSAAASPSCHTVSTPAATTPPTTTPQASIASVASPAVETETATTNADAVASPAVTTPPAVPAAVAAVAATESSPHTARSPPSEVTRRSPLLEPKAPAETPSPQLTTQMTKSVALVAACSLNRVIGRRGVLPWPPLAADWAFLCTATQGQVLVVGRRSFEEFGAPLPGRHTIVVSPSSHEDKRRRWRAMGVAVAPSLEAALTMAQTAPEYAASTRVFIGGGERLYEEALAKQVAESCWITRVHTVIPDGDAFLPRWTQQFPVLRHCASTTSGALSTAQLDSAMADAMATTTDAPTKTPLELFKQSFREYLRETKAVDSDAELDQLMELLHQPLPISFRLNLHRPDAPRVMQLLANELQFERDTFFYKDTTAVNPPFSIPWYPVPNVAWQVDCGRVALSKTAPKHEPVKRFHSCLLEHTDMGTIDRQEAVSMLPVLFLDVQPGHRVLDMCASPGSKTTQVIDFLLTNTNITEDSPTSGMVIANDLDKKRAYMLVHRLSRNTLRNAVVTCGSGDQFPGLYDRETKSLHPTNVFDRVLCDVPCSGDGTLRKSQTLWKEWHIGQGLTLHPIQLSLALRSAALLKIGGMMVYSTCSFNPIENEAVVAELLRRTDGALELLDVSHKLPGLRYRKGRTNWQVGWRSKSKSSNKGHVFKAANGTDDEQDSSATKLHEWFEAYDKLPQELRGNRIIRSMFAPAADSPIANELTKTLRLIPIDQNSGGFFIAVLRKTRKLPGSELQEGLPGVEEDLELTPPVDYVCKLCNESGHFMKNCVKYLPTDEFQPAKKQKVTDADSEKDTGASKAKEGGIQRKETLYRPIPDDIWGSIKQFYEITDESLKGHLWCRSDGAANINYVDNDIIDTCLGGDALDIVNTGLRVFRKTTERGEVFYRPSEEGLGFIDRFFSQRVITVPQDDFVALLRAGKHIPLTELSTETQEVTKDLSMGPLVAQLASDKSVSINLWVGTNALLPRVSKMWRAEVEQALARA